MRKREGQCRNEKIGQFLKEENEQKGKMKNRKKENRGKRGTENEERGNWENFSSLWKMSKRGNVEKENAEMGHF